MKSVISSLVVLAIVQAISANSAPVAGDAGWSAHFSGTQASPWVEIGNANTISTLKGHFTIELWFKAEVTVSNEWHPIISHFFDGPYGARNVHNDFNLQITRSGELCFFMGNGLGQAPSSQSYGILWFSASAIQPFTWYHVAVTFEGSDETSENYTPHTVTIYLNGEKVGAPTWNNGNTELGGRRRLNPSRINVGRYNNSDPGHQVFAGDIDEVRLWSYIRPASDIALYSTRQLKGNEPGLVHYYRFDNPSSNIIQDLVGTAPGDFKSYAEGGEPFAYVVSGVPIDIWTSTPNNKVLTVNLKATDADNNPIYFRIASLPTGGKLYAVVGGLAGPEITTTDYVLPNRGSQVAYKAFGTFSNKYDIFTYVAEDRQGGVSQPSTVHIYVEQANDCPQGYDSCGVCGGNDDCLPGCDGRPGTVYDDCGVCGGDGTSCTCIVDEYRNYTLSQLDRILVHYNIELTLSIIHDLSDTLRQTLEKLYDPNPGLIDLKKAVDTVRNFNDRCLVGFSQEMEQFRDGLQH